MSQGSRKVLAVLTVCLTALGILLSIFMLVQVWRNRQSVTDKLQATLEQSSNILHTTDEGLDVIDRVISNVYTSTIYLDEATQAFSQTVQSTSSFLDSADTFIGENLVTTITNTQVALDSAQASAKVIDNILVALSRIPLIGIDYNPTLPLNITLGKVSTSLDPLQGTLKNFQTDLATTQENMQVFTTQISALDKNIIAIDKNLRQAQTTIDSYRSQLSTLKSWIDRAINNLPVWINTISWILTIIILWLVIVQITIMLQGISLLTPDRARQEMPTEE